MKSRLLGCILLIFVSVCTWGTPQERPPFNREEILELLRGGVASQRVAGLVQENGVDFELSREDERRLQEAGADESLLDAIRRSGPGLRAALQHVRAGEEAERSGFRAKAATEYTQAWQLVSAREDLGLKAARLWSELGEHVQAARILNALVPAAREPTLTEARALFTNLQSAFNSTFDAKMTQGLNAISKQDYTAALRAFQDASTILPGRGEPHIGVARVHALGNSYEGMTNAILTAVRQGNVLASQLLAYKEFDPFLGEPRFREFLNSVFGSSAVDLAMQTKQTRVIEEQEERQRAGRRAFLEVRISEMTKEAETEEATAQEAAQKATLAETKARYSSTTSSTLGGLIGSAISKSKYESDAKKWRAQELEHGNKASKLRQEIAAMQAELAQLTPPARSADAPVAPQVAGLPPADWKILEHSAFKMSYPEEWQTMGTDQALYITPQAVYTPEGMTAGVFAGVYPNVGFRISLDDVVKGLIQGWQYMHAGLTRMGGMPDTTTVAGVRAKSVHLLGPSVIGGIGRYHNWLVAFQNRSGTTVYLVFFAKEAEYEKNRPTFERMLLSVKF